MKQQTTSHAKWLSQQSYATPDLAPPFAKGRLGGIEIVQYPPPVKAPEALSPSSNTISTINTQQRKRALAQCALLSAALIAFINTTNAQTTPSTEAYKPDPITTTSQALQGKLFFNDAERAKVNQARKDIAAGKVVIDSDSTERAPVLSGFIKRSDGVATYWVNGGGANDTRFVTGIDKTASTEILATSTMVGGEPKFVLSGTMVGKKGADAKSKSSKGNAKKTTIKLQKKKLAPKKKNRASKSFKSSP